MAPVRSRFGAPKGFFSDLDWVQKKKVEGEIIVPFQNSPAASSGSLRDVCGFHQDAFQPWPIFWSHHSSAHLVGRTLVLLNDQKQASLEAMYNLHCYRDDPAYRILRLPAPVRLKGNWTSVLSRWTVEQNYYHWFLDTLPRLALLQQFPSDTQILVPPNLSSYQRITLSWLGLEKRVRPTAEQHLVLEDFYFSSPTAMTGCSDSYAITFLRNAFLKFADKSYESPRRFYIKRTGKSRGIVNENEVIEEMCRRGWAIVDCETLTLAQQIQLFANAEAICTLHGAALTNLLWCPSRCKVFELVAQNFLNGVYEGMAESLSLDYRFLICEADAAFRAYVKMEDFKKFLEG